MEGVSKVGVAGFQVDQNEYQSDSLNPFQTPIVDASLEDGRDIILEPVNPLSGNSPIE